MLDALGEMYRVDAAAKAHGLSPEARLVHHQTHNQPVLDQLQARMRRQLDEKRVEPNSGLGQALSTCPAIGSP